MSLTDLVPVTFWHENHEGKEGLIIWWCPSDVEVEDEDDAEDHYVFVTWAFPDGTTWVTPRDLWNIPRGES